MDVESVDLEVVAVTRAAERLGQAVPGGENVLHPAAEPFLRAAGVGHRSVPAPKALQSVERAGSGRGGYGHAEKAKESGRRKEGAVQRAHGGWLNRHLWIGTLCGCA